MNSSNLSLPDIEPGLGVQLAAAIEAMPASRLVGLRVLGFAPGGRSVLELPIASQITFDGRRVQGGIVGLLADYAGVSAANVTLEPGWAASTTSFEVHHLAPAQGDRLVAVGEAVQVGKTHAVSTVRVWALSGDQATLVAVGTTTCRPYQLKN